MLRLSRNLTWVLVGTLLLSASSVQAEEEKSAKAKPPKAESDHIQLAILLDTSNSMDGLISQARTQLWKIVNELATAERDGQVPKMQVALYEYGKSTLSQDSGYVRQLVPLTDDLDKISEELFALKTKGGKEYCGQVISTATNELKWSASQDDLKLIFIAGNEPFTQGPVDYKKACSDAIAQGITVNTIFCGPEKVGVSTGWQNGAQLADGSFLNIDQNRKVAAVKTPFDEKLNQLSSQVNKTYLAFGPEPARRKLSARQATQDKLAKEAAPSAGAERAAFKGSGRYRTSGDLVDALADGKVKLKDIKDSELPDELKKMSLEERKKHIEKKKGEREKIQKEIQELSQKRKEFIAKKRREEAEKSNEAKADTLDAAVIKAIRSQAEKKKFDLKP